MKKLSKGIFAAVTAAGICLAASVGCLASGAVIGDADANNVIDIRDLIRTKKYAVSQSAEISLDAVDFDYNGYVDASDIITVKKIILFANGELGVNSENLEDIIVTTID